MHPKQVQQHSIFMAPSKSMWMWRTRTISFMMT